MGFNVIFFVFLCLRIAFEVVIPIAKMPKVWDPFWQYGEPEDGTNRKNLSCKLCGHHMSGEVNKLKYHLTKLPGHHVGLCTAMTLEIMRSAHDAIHEKNRKKDEIAANKAELAAFGQARSAGASLSTTISEGSGRGSTALPIGGAGLSSHFVGRTGPVSQPSIKSIVKKSEKVEADRVMGMCLYRSHIPLNIVKNNPFWQLMCDAIAVVGPRYKSATFEELQGPIL